MQYENRALHRSAARVVLAIAMAGSCVFAQAETKEQQPAATSPGVAGAEETELPPVTVSAHEGVAVPYNNTGVDVTIVDLPKMKEEGWQTLSGVMTQVPGVYSVPGGGLNQRGYANRPIIRGMEDYDYTLPVVDGMRLQRSGSRLTGTFGGLQSIFDMGSLEVIKGGQGAVYGGGAVGGVVSIDTPMGQGPASVTIFNEAGSFDSYTGYVTARGSQGKLDYFVGSGYEHTNNDLKTDPAVDMGLRHQGRFTQWQGAARVGYMAAEKTKITFTYRGQEAEYTGWNSDSMAKTYVPTTYDYRSNLATAKIESELTKLWSSSFMAGFYGYDSDLDVSPVNGKPSPRLRTNLRSWQTEWRNALRWSDRNTTTAGMSWNRNQYEKDGSKLSGEPKNVENILGFFAEHLYRPVKTWDNSFALRLDHSNAWGNNLTYRYATSWKVTGENSPTRLLGSVSSGYRAPSYFERNAEYFAGTYYWKGNPDLKLSKSLGGDLGIEQRLFERHYFTLTGFWTRVDDAITNISLGKTEIPGIGKKTTKQYVNAGHQTSVGFESALRGNFEDAWNSGYALAYTYTESKGEDDRQWESTARNVWSADLHTSPVDSVTTGIGFAAASGRTGSSGARIDNYFVLRWYAQWKATKNLTFHLRVENITGDRFVTQVSNPAAHTGELNELSAGAAVYGGFTLRF